MPRIAKETARPNHHLREWRKHRGYSLERVAEMIGMTHQNLGKVERGAVAYTQPLLEKLAEAYNTDPASLIWRDPADADAIYSIWDDVPAERRAEAVDLLRVLTKKAS